LDSLGFSNIAESYLDNQKENKEIKEEIVKVTTLDRLMINLPVSNKITFIKCDVEGAELMVFKGGMNFLSKYHPTILCEIEEKNTDRYEYKPEELIDFLKNFNYDIFIFVSGKLTSIKKVQKSIINYIFIHKSLINKYIKSGIL